MSETRSQWLSLREIHALRVLLRDFRQGRKRRTNQFDAGIAHRMEKLGYAELGSVGAGLARKPVLFMTDAGWQKLQELRGTEYWAWIDP